MSLCALLLLLCAAGPSADEFPPPGWPAYLADLRPPEGISFRVCLKDGMPQAAIPAGEFVMGTDEQTLIGNQGPARKIFISAFWMDLHEVTNEQFCRFLNEEQPPKSQLPKWIKIAKKRASAIQQRRGQFLVKPGFELHPVSYVSWEGASAYARWAGRKLPTEAQWERAARGGREAIRYVWGNAWPPPAGAGNLADLSALEAIQHKLKPSQAVFVITEYRDGYGETAPVCSFNPNPFGLFDMVGNLSEWCLDWYDGEWLARMPERDPCNRVAGEYRVMRDGSWGDMQWEYLITHRNADTPDACGSNIGFRCASETETPET